MTTRSSLLGYYVRGDAQEIQAQRGLDASAALYLINNLNHLQDEQCQTWGSFTGILGGAQSFGYFECTDADTSTWHLFQNMPPVPVFLRVKADGSSTRFVVRLNWCSSTGGTRVSVLVRLTAFDPTGTVVRQPPDADASDPSSLQLTTTQGALSDTSSVSQAVVYLDNQTRFEPYRFATTSGDENGNAASVYPMMAQIEVWGQTSSGGVFPVIGSLNVREFIG